MHDLLCKWSDALPVTYPPPWSQCNGHTCILVTTVVSIAMSVKLSLPTLSTYFCFSHAVTLTCHRHNHTARSGDWFGVCNHVCSKTSNRGRGSDGVYNYMQLGDQRLQVLDGSKSGNNRCSTCDT